VRDLWSLRLQRLPTYRTTYDSETETEGGRSQQLFSSQSEGETSASGASSHISRRRQGQQKPGSGTPSVIDCLSLCYTAFLLLREPITVADIHGWAQNGELLFFGAAREVPLGMRERLPAVYQDLLEPRSIPRPDKLCKCAINLLTTFHTEFGMQIPAINYPLILYRWMKELALPIEIFAATQRLAKVLELDFNFILEKSDGRRKDAILRHPETRLVALMTVATKLLFPFDEVRRFPRSATDLAALGMDWEKWVDFQSGSNVHDGSESGSEAEDHRTKKEVLPYRNAMDFTEADILKASDEGLDQYMDWFERNLATEEIRERGKGGKDAEFRRALFRLFPVGKAKEPSSGPAGKTNSHPHADRAAQEDQRMRDRLQAVTASMKTQRVVTEEEEAETNGKEVPRAGSYYRRIRTVGDLKVLGPAGKVFFERAAALVGTSLEGMVRAVAVVEGGMGAWEDTKRKEGGEG
jgi:RNA polymerase I-specific transcription initiation factor RRN7